MNAFFASDKNIWYDKIRPIITEPFAGYDLIRVFVPCRPHSEDILDIKFFPHIAIYFILDSLFRTVRQLAEICIPDI